MPRLPRDLPRTPLSRRAALLATVGLTGLALVGCTSEEPRRGEDAPRPAEPKVDPDVAVAAEALANQEQILALLDATRNRHQGLGDLLAPAVAVHESHAALLAEAVPGDVSAAPSASVSPSTSASPSPSDPRRTSVPRDRGRALQQVVAAERELALATKRHAFRAESGAFARLLGSMAAAAAQQETVLASATVPRGGGS